MSANPTPLGLDVGCDHVMAEGCATVVAEVLNGGCTGLVAIESGGLL